MTNSTTAPRTDARVDAQCAADGMPFSGLGHILDAHTHLLEQILDLVNQLKAAAPSGFVYAHKAGPHVRHILEHYTAFFDALDDLKSGGTGCVDYDSRPRNRLVESDSDAARSMIASVQREIARGRASFPRDLATPLSTSLTSGPRGETKISAPTSVGRELLFLESHTVHHMALLAHYASGLGVALDQDFGKAPATIAFERNGPRARS